MSTYSSTQIVALRQLWRWPCDLNMRGPLTLYPRIAMLSASCSSSGLLGPPNGTSSEAGDTRYVMLMSTDE